MFRLGEVFLRTRCRDPVGWVRSEQQVQEWLARPVRRAWAEPVVLQAQVALLVVAQAVADRVRGPSGCRLVRRIPLVAQSVG